MSVERNIQLAELWFEALWGEADLDVANEIVHPDYAPEWVHIDAIGPNQVKHEVRYFRSIFPDLKYEIVDMTAKEDSVWVRYKGVGTQKGNAWGFEPTGKKVTFEGVTILVASHEGKIIDRWGAFCFYVILTDLGLVPPFWELRQYLDWSPEG
jgi:predicted ester cyclase